MPEEITLARGEQLRAYRKRLKLLQIEAYVIAGVTYATLISIETGSMKNIDDELFDQIVKNYRNYELSQG